VEDAFYAGVVRDYVTIFPQGVNVWGELGFAYITVEEFLVLLCVCFLYEADVS
jgi:hypothetical protein